MAMPPLLTAGRWELRAMRPEDWRIEQLLSEDPDVPRWTPYPPSMTEAAARRRARARARDWLAGASFQYVIRAAGEDCGIAIVLPREGVAEVGYALRPQARGRGAATEATRALLRPCAEAGFRQARLTILDGNLASEGLARRLGFRRRERGTARKDGRLVPTGIWTRDLEPMVATSGDFRGRRVARRGDTPSEGTRHEP